MTLEPKYVPYAQNAVIEIDAVNMSSPAYRTRVEDAAVKFEGLFIAQMLSEMKKATDQLKGDDGFADRSSDAMLDYANRAVADAIAQQRGFGIANTLVAQMLPPDATPSKV